MKLMHGILHNFSSTFRMVPNSIRLKRQYNTIRNRQTCLVIGHPPDFDKPQVGRNIRRQLRASCLSCGTTTTLPLHSRSQRIERHGEILAVSSSRCSSDLLCQHHSGFFVRVFAAVSYCQANLIVPVCWSALNTTMHRDVALPGRSRKPARSGGQPILV